MIIEIEKDVEKTIVKVVGRLDANSAPSLENFFLLTTAPYPFFFFFSWSAKCSVRT